MLNGRQRTRSQDPSRARISGNVHVFLEMAETNDGRLRNYDLYLAITGLKFVRF